MKLRARHADWPLVLKAARAETTAYRESDFSLSKGLTELISSGSAGEDTEGSLTDLLCFLTDLQKALAITDLSNAPAAAGDHLLKLLVMRTDHVELRMYKEVGHQRPHFHLEYKREYSASYALDTFEVLAGYMPARYERAILSMAKSKRNELIATWESLNGRARAHVPAQSA